MDELARMRERMAELETTETQSKRIAQLQHLYVRTVAHDLRNLLTVVQGQAQLIQRFTKETDRLHKSAEMVVISSRRINKVIEDLVDSARLVTGRAQLNAQPVDLRALVLQLLDNTRATLDVERIRVDVPADLPRVSADRHRLKRVLMELLTDALRCSPKGTEVVLRAEKSGHEVLHSITRHRTEVAPEEVPDSFEPLDTAGAGRRDRPTLGLYVTLLLIEAHGGRLWIERESPERCTVRFSLPIS